MFEQHQKIIERHAKRSADGMADVFLFCILSARMPFARIASDFKKVKAGNTSPLFAWKHRAWDDMQQYKAQRFEDFRTCWRYSHDCYTRTGRGTLADVMDEMLVHVMEWEGLGPAKGGFFLQMVTGMSACLDSRNVETYDIDAIQKRLLRSVPASATVGRRKKLARAYHDLCFALTGNDPRPEGYGPLGQRSEWRQMSASLWDAWCMDVAENAAYDYATGWDVSAEHCKILGLDPGKRPTDLIDDVSF